MTYPYKPHIFMRNGQYCVTLRSGSIAIPMLDAVMLAVDFVKRISA